METAIGIGIDIFSLIAMLTFIVASLAVTVRLMGLFNFAGCLALPTGMRSRCNLNFNSLPKGDMHD